MNMTRMRMNLDHHNHDHNHNHTVTHNQNKSVSACEPWLCPLSLKLHSNVCGFVAFLESRLSIFKTGSIEEVEIQDKIRQLLVWKQVAETILPLSSSRSHSFLIDDYSQRDLRKRIAFNRFESFIDRYEIKSERYEIFNTNLARSGKVVKVVFPLQAKKLRSAPVKQVQSPTLHERERDSEEESKQSEAIFHNQQQQEDQSFFHQRYKFQDLPIAFVFDKCIRRVQRNQENREIFTAFKCQFDPVSRKVVNLFTNEKFIIKRVGKSGSNEMLNTRLRREFKAQQILTQLGHENINKLVYYFEDNFNIYSISESAGDKDMLDLLAEYVGKFRQGFPEKLVKKLFKNVAEGLAVAHNLGIAHRDVSLENLVLNNYSSNKEKIEIIDWGHCVGVERRQGSRDELDVEFEQTPYEGQLGKVKYMSPELIYGEREGVKRYDALKSDVFAFGVCLFSVLTGQMPFQRVDDDRGQLLKVSAEQLIKALNSRRSINESELSHQALDLLNNTLKWNPKERISMKEVLQHPFFM